MNEFSSKAPKNDEKQSNTNNPVVEVMI